MADRFRILNAATDQLAAVVDQVFPQEQGFTKVAVNELSFEEKMALGQRNCEQLAQLAANIPEIRKIAAVDAAVSQTPGACDETQALLSRLSRR